MKSIHAQQCILETISAPRVIIIIPSNLLSTSTIYYLVAKSTTLS
ncbi:hypothetical protein H375_6600 [Rickettsia prowazekii str. Breinl]|nr:hypothetical protein H375_6600 [Rickettsia prowazekii str. Breinl]